MANVITVVRLICALNLIFCPTFSTGFFVVYLIGGISDVLDGIVARRSGTETKFGERFDTVADIAFFVTVIVKVVRAISVPIWLHVWIGCIGILKCVNIISGFVRFKCFVAQHTALNKICGILLFSSPLCLGWIPHLTVEPLIAPIAAIATFSAIEEGYRIRAGKEETR